jgi:hypothetical protein
MHRAFPGGCFGPLEGDFRLLLITVARRTYRNGRRNQSPK